MKRYYSYILLSLSSLFACLSCEQWDLDEEEFLQVQFTGLEPLSLDSARLSAVIKDLVAAQAESHGFVWTTDGTTPTIFANGGKEDLRVKEAGDDPSFAAVLGPLPLNTEFTLVAYAEVDGQVYYSQSRKYETGTGSVATLSFHYEDKFSIELTGQLSGTDRGIVATRHGFCWSVTDSLPTLADEVLDEGNRRNDEPFTYTQVGLENNKPRYFRAFAVLLANFELDTVYGEVLFFDGDLRFWTQKPDFPDWERRGAIGFGLDNKGYLGLGILIGLSKDIFVKDFWQYNSESGEWSQVAELPGPARGFAAGFVIGEKLFLGAGEGFTETYNDFWEYDPELNQWKRLADIPGTGHGIVTGFATEGMGYIITPSELWQYNPNSDSWTRKGDAPGPPRKHAVSFAIEGKGYFGMGVNNQGEYLNDFWEYDPSLNSWTIKASIPGPGRAAAVSFVLGEMGYVTTGDAGVLLQEIWGFSPKEDIWDQGPRLPGPGRYEAFGFATAGKGIVGLGSSTKDFFIEVYLTDIWEYDP